MVDWTKARAKHTDGQSTAMTPELVHYRSLSNQMNSGSLILSLRLGLPVSTFARILLTTTVVHILRRGT